MVAAAYSSNVIVACLVPSPPPVGRGLWSFWLTPPRLCGGSVFYRDMALWYGCCRLLAAMSSLRARYHTTKYDVALFSLQAVPLSLL